MLKQLHINIIKKILLIKSVDLKIKSMLLVKQSKYIFVRNIINEIMLLTCCFSIRINYKNRIKIFKTFILSDNL